tara:strand:+ start:405 stop:587 length:183 start_codon:yes stop_codon:yes gene_type:complete
MILNEKEFEYIDSSEKITIADSFVHPAQKLGIVDGQLFDLLPLDGREKYFEFHKSNIFKS